MKYVNSSGTLTCPICNRAGMKYLTSHIKRTHKMSKEDFTTKYPDCPLVAPCYEEKFKANMSKGHSAGGQKLRELHKDDEEWSTKVRQTHSDARKKMWTRDDYRDKMSIVSTEANKVKWQDNSYRYKKIYTVCRQIITGRHGLNNYGVDIEYNGLILKSNPELKVAELLDSLKIKYFYEGIYVMYYREDGLLRSYIPDFYLPHLNLVIEVKLEDEQIDDEAISKKVATESYGYSYILVTQTEISKLHKVLQDFNCSQY